jgi:hypothetical protein
MLRPFAWFLLGSGALACGTNRPEASNELPAPSTEGCENAGYPSGPYGTEPGSVMENVCLKGWLEPDRVARVEATLTPAALGSFHDPDGRRNIRLLLINTAALWCSACRVEHETLPKHAAALRNQGLVVITALFQGVDGKPATFRDLKVWVEAYDTNFPILLDPEYSFQGYASASTAPLNLVVDPRTMRILQKYVGDQSSVIWPYVEGELARRR